MADKIPLTIRIFIYIQVFLRHMNLLRLFNIQLHWAILNVIYSIIIFIIYLFPIAASTWGFSPYTSFACIIYNFATIVYCWAAMLKFILMFFACTFSNSLQIAIQRITELQRKVKARCMAPTVLSIKHKIQFILPITASCICISTLRIYRRVATIMTISSWSTEYLEMKAMTMFPYMSSTAAVFTYQMLHFVSMAVGVAITSNGLLYISLIYYICQELHHLHRYVTATTVPSTLQSDGLL